MKQSKKWLLLTFIFSLLGMIVGTWALMTSGKTSDDKLVGGRLHDDYQKDDLDRFSNKNIYVENYGTEALIVRVKLLEYLENNHQPLLSGTTKQDKNTWIPYGLPSSSKSNMYRKYVTWELGGQKNFLPTFNHNPDSLESDASGDALDMLTNTQTALGDGSVDYFKKGQTVSHPDDPSLTHRVKTTLTQTQAPISMSQWKSLSFDQQEGSYWVIDQDGWAYWSQLLPATEATSLLINGLSWQLSGIGDLENWVYQLKASGEYTPPYSRLDFGESSEGAPSEDGWRLMNRISPPTSLVLGESFDFYGEEYIYLKDLGQGNKLVLRKYLLEEDLLTSTDYKGSPLEQKLNEYYDGLAPQAKAAVQPVTLNYPLCFLSKEDVQLDSSGFLAPQALTDLTTVSESGIPRAFALSLADLTSVSGKGKAFPTLTSRSGTKQSSPQTFHHWWLRTPSDITYKGMSRADLIPGQLSPFTDEMSIGVRPALIIRY